MKSRKILIAQFVEEINKSPETTPPKIDKSTLPGSPVVDKAHKELTNVLQSQETYNQIATYLEPFLQVPVDAFIAKTKDKAPEYLANPELLIKDLEEEIPLAKYVSYVSKAIDVLFISITLAEIAATIFSAGAATPATAASAVVTTAVKATLSQFIKKEGINILKKVFSKIILKKIAKFGVTELSKGFISSVLYWNARIIILDTLSVAASDVALTAAKNLLIEKGVSELGLPKETIDVLIKPETTADAFKRILINSKDKAYASLQELFTSERGFKNLAVEMALSRVRKLIGTKAFSTAIYQREKILSYVQDPKNNNPNTYKSNYQKLKDKFAPDNNNSQDGSESSDSKAKSQDKIEVSKLLEKSILPKSLYSKYQEYVAEFTKNIPEINDKTKKAQDLIHTAELKISAINDSIYELVMIDFVKENKTFFMSNPKKLNEFIRQITDIDNMSLDDLLANSETTSVDVALQDLYKQKMIEINNMLEIVSFTGNPNSINDLRVYLMNKLDVKGYKRNLSKEVFGRDYNSQAPKK